MIKYNILIAESLDIKVFKDYDVGFNNQSRQINFFYKPDISQKELEKEIINYDGLITRPKEIRKNILENAKNLKLIIRGGTGVNSIDLEYARSKNIDVLNTPGLNSNATAEFTFYLISKLLCKRNINKCHEEVLSNNESNVESYSGFELKGKKIAIIGFGEIGKNIAKKLNGFDTIVRSYSRSLTPEIAKKHNVEYYSDLDLVAMDNDLITIHMPLTDKTDKLFNKSLFDKIKKSTAIVNTARPQIIDPEALINNGNEFAIDGDKNLIEEFINLDIDNKGIYTHHIADATYEAQRDITKSCIEQTILYFKEKEIVNLQN